MVATLKSQDTNEADRRFVLRDVPWWMYVALRDELDESGTRMTYLEGTLELISPSTLHEDAKTIIARLLEVWAMERDVDLRGFGNATFRREAKKHGLEPDECYKLGPLADDGVPDLAIEVVVSNPLVDKMQVYAGLGIPEVWVWSAAAKELVVYRLVDHQYQVREHSELLPDLDLVQLAQFIRPGESQTALAKALRNLLRR